MKSPHELKFVFHTWEIRVSHADAKPTPMETPVTLLTWENRTGSLSRPGWRMLGLELPFTYCYGQRHSRQLCPPQMTAENCTDKTHSETHQLRDHLRGGERKLQFITRTRTGNPPRTHDWAYHRSRQLGHLFDFAFETNGNQHADAPWQEEARGWGGRGGRAQRAVVLVIHASRVSAAHFRQGCGRRRVGSSSMVMQEQRVGLTCFPHARRVSHGHTRWELLTDSKGGEKFTNLLVF